MLVMHDCVQTFLDNYCETRIEKIQITQQTVTLYIGVLQQINFKSNGIASVEL